MDREGEDSHPRRNNEASWLAVNSITFIRYLGITATIIFLVVLGYLWFTDRFAWTAVGYPGIWLINLLGAGSIIIPVPALAATCGAAAPAPGPGLNPFFIGIISGSAEAIGELTGYTLGFSGHEALKRHRLYMYVQRMFKRYGAVILFVGSVIPNPFFDIAGIAAGNTRYPLRKFLPVVFAGKSIKSSGIAWGCYFGIDLVVNFINPA